MSSIIGNSELKGDALCRSGFNGPAAVVAMLLFLAVARRHKPFVVVRLVPEDGTQQTSATVHLTVPPE